MSKLVVSQRTPRTYDAATIHRLFELIEQFVNALPQYATGTFTLDEGADTTVSDENVFSDSTILFMPTNAAAATLMASSESLYVSDRTDQTSFTVSTADGGDAAGTETFQYIIIN